MKTIDNNGILLCKIQANLFKNYASFSQCSPYFFVRRFMNSELATRFDDKTVLLEASSNETFVSELDEQYGKTSFGNPNSVDKEIMYWVGYLYRYWSYVYNIPSSTLINHVKPDMLFSRYELYHSQDMSYVVERITEEEQIMIRPNKTIQEVLDEYYEFMKNKNSN